MNKLIVLVMIGVIAFVSCKEQTGTPKESNNPFFTEWTTPFEAPPFDKIKTEHYEPAFDKGLQEHDEEIAMIANNTQEPTFENTILALDESGQLLSRVARVFFNVSQADGNDEIQTIEEKYAPILTKHGDEIYMNDQLFARVKAVYEQRESLNLGIEENKLIENYYKTFVRGGINLPPEAREQLKKINEDITALTTKFGNNLLAENKQFQLVISDEKDLSGLPESSIHAAAEKAKAADQDGKWIFTLDKPSWIPFMQFADKRDLRETMYKAYINRGNNNDSLDNKAILEKIATLRARKAGIMGYKTWADFIISDNMAKTSDAANALINNIVTATIPNVKKEAAELQQVIDRSGDSFKLEAWDWWYYTEKLRKERYDLDEEAMRPYFSLENAREGLFLLCEKLWGLQFEKIDYLPVYNDEVLTYAVKDSDDSLLGIVYFDYFPRPGKRGGAWMDNIKEEYFKGEERSAPIVVNVCNFTRPVGDTPALLSIDETETMFHEFGHALHGLLTQCKFRSTSGTNVASDFVELPSQLMENWVLEPEMLRLYARHYKTGEVIPDDLVHKIQAARKFNQGFVTMELIAATVLDMDWHTLADTVQREAVSFEKASMKRMGLIPEIEPRYSSWYFNHVFGSDPGYSAGYYAYTWAAVLDADAYQAFAETGDIFNRKVAENYRKFILEKGDSDDVAKLYRDFRGKDATPDAYLKRKGF